MCKIESYSCAIYWGTEQVTICSEEFFDSSTGYIDASSMLQAEAFYPIKLPNAHHVKISPVVKNKDNDELNTDNE